MNDSALAPPPLERFSADKFRQWLAGMVNQDAPATRTDRDEMKSLLVEFLSVCPLVYGLNDRMVMWEKIGNAAAAALETCDNDLMVWVNDIFAAIDAPAGRVAACEPLRQSLATLDARPDYWKVECLRVMRALIFTLPVLARERWNSEVKDAPSEARIVVDRSVKNGGGMYREIINDLKGGDTIGN